MLKRSLRYRLAALAATLALLAPAAPAVAQASGSVLPSVGIHPHAVPVAMDANAHFSCQNRHLGDPSGRAACYSPQQIQAAYGVDKLIANGITGKGRTIVIVDAFSNPYIATDLQIFDAWFGLPAPHALNIIYPDGQTPFDFNDPNQVGWSGEISLDVLWAHAIAPDATIDLVLGRSNNDADLNSATKYVVDHNLGDVVSQSFGEAESCALPSDLKTLHKIYQKATDKAITLVASSGDQGAAQPTCDGTAFFKSASWPAVDPLVTSIGGTNLQADMTTGAYQFERAWADPFSGCFPTTDFGCSGGGFSNIYGRPDYQEETPHTMPGHRGVPDVAYNGGVDGGVLTHWGVGLQERGFSPTDTTRAFIFGGTSAGSPQWSGLVALADQLGHGRVGQINDALYETASHKNPFGAAFHDITTGNNNYQNVDLSTITGFQATTGWDAVTGLGTPKANVLVPLLAEQGNSNSNH